MAELISRERLPVSPYPIEIDADLIERELDGLARFLLVELRVRGLLPTKREHVERLRRISRTAFDLFEQLGYFSGEEGRMRLGATQVVAHLTANSKLRDLLCATRPEFATPTIFDMRLDEALRKPLTLLADFARKQADDIEVVTTGAGHLALHDRLFGDPRLGLAIRCVEHIAHHCGPEKVTSTDGGFVHMLMNEVWSFATGLDPEEANLPPFLKQGCRWLRDPRPITRLLEPTLNRAKKSLLRS